MTTILLPNIGLPATRGTLHMLREGGDVRIIGTDSNKDVLERRWVDRFYEVPPTTHPAFLEMIAQIIKTEKVDVALPQSDREAVVLAEHLDIPVAASDPAVTRRACDKGELMQLFFELGLPAPRHHVVENAIQLRQAALELGYPHQKLVVKPTALWGRRGTHTLSAHLPDLETLLSTRCDESTLTLDQLAHAIDQAPQCPPLLLMEHLPGAEYSVDAFLGQNAAIAIPRLRESISGGTAFRTTIDLRQDLREYTLTAARILGLRCAFGMQFKCDARGLPKVLECNARLQGTTIASSFAGVNFATMAIQEALGNPPPQPTGPLKTCTFSRHWGGVAFEGDWQQFV